MIQQTELRIGNLVNCVDDRIGPVVEIKSGRVLINMQRNRSTAIDYSYSYDELSPIPLDSSLLIRAGFTKNPSFPDRYNHDYGDHIVIRGVEFVYRMPGVSLKDVRYLHELQNIHYAISGKELVIKD